MVSCWAEDNIEKLSFHVMKHFTLVSVLRFALLCLVARPSASFDVHAFTSPPGDRVIMIMVVTFIMMVIVILPPLKNSPYLCVVNSMIIAFNPIHTK